MASLWDDPAIKAASTNSGYVKFDEVGSSVTGTIATMGKHTWPDGSLGIKIEFAEEGVPSLTASQVMLKSALFELKPEVGDKLDIELIDITAKGGKTLKKFRVEHTNQTGETKVIDQS